MEANTLGWTLEQMDTPALLVDLDVMEANIRWMANYFKEHGVAWRPHSKCHKSSLIARKLIEAGAIGATCAKLGEAEVLAAGGIEDILIANPLAGTTKLRRLTNLRHRADPIAIADHIDHVDQLSEACESAKIQLRVLVEVDIGLNRVGTQPGEPTRQLARRIDQAPGLELAGIMGYEGHLLRVADPDEKRRRIHESVGLLNDTKSQLERDGLACPIVSAGGTGSFLYTAAVEGVTEIQAGGGIFMDLMYRNQCQVQPLDFALTVLATVTSRPTADRAIIDAGRKTMNMELETPRALRRDDVEITSLSAEHGSLAVAHGPGPKIGERIEFVVGYSDFTTVLHNHFVGVRDGKVELIWPLEARGRLD